jgi:Fic family protein
MRREATGHYEDTSTAGETVRAFVPAPLPPEPPLVLDATLQALHERALLACGRLDGVSSLLPNPELFRYAYVRREALCSSQIEGTQSSLSDLLLFELEEAPGVPFDDVVEVSSYGAGLEHGVARLAEGLPLSSRLLREIHGRRLARGHGADRLPGEFRRSQNWIGGTRPGNAHFVPPPRLRAARWGASAGRLGGLDRVLFGGGGEHGLGRSGHGPAIAGAVPR